MILEVFNSPGNKGNIQTFIYTSTACVNMSKGIFVTFLFDLVATSGKNANCKQMNACKFYHA